MYLSATKSGVRLGIHHLFQRLVVRQLHFTEPARAERVGNDWQRVTGQALVHQHHRTRDWTVDGPAHSINGDLSEDVTTPYSDPK